MDSYGVGNVSSIRFRIRECLMEPIKVGIRGEYTGKTSSASKIIYQQPTNISFYNIEGDGYSVRKVNSVIT